MENQRFAWYGVQPAWFFSSLSCYSLVKEMSYLSLMVSLLSWYSAACIYFTLTKEQEFFPRVFCLMEQLTASRETSVFRDHWWLC